MKEADGSAVADLTTEAAAGEGQRTDPRTFLVRGVGILSQLVIPIGIASFTILDDGNIGTLIAFVIPAIVAVIGVNLFFAYIRWSRLTYTVGAQDIRVDSGVLSRAARSVPFERIQDVSLEQKLVPRLFCLVEVKFETGAGGGEDLSLAYLSEAEGERLRRVVRERKNQAAASAPEAGAGESAVSETSDEASETLFAMGPRRLLVFGMFEFSLAVFAVLGGLLQYVDSFVGIELWDPDLWQSWIEDQSSWFSSFGFLAQAAGAAAGVIALLVIGSGTGLVRTFLRDWEFRLERTARGFRRRRGLLTKTDVVMPVHRVQAIRISTRMIRYRFGWHGLKFISLAQDAGASNHDVAPFARMEEIAPIVAEAGFHLPGEGADWRRASERYRLDSMLFNGIGLFLIVAMVAGISTTIYAPEWALVSLVVALILGVINAALTLYSWQFHRHALDGEQIMASRGLLSPTSKIATRLKLHSVEISQGPIARRRGYATLDLGLAGGVFAIPGVPVQRAEEVRAAVLETIAATDFSQLEHT